ncbi:MAG: PBSX family phage terminase large subunit, partial [Clostridia bacterium]|nr:PBSX family phage terminase large subunit [Clostridia bacterium]
KKSTTTALNLIYRLLKYPEANILVVRAVMNTHRDSTFAQLKWAQEKLLVSHLFKNTVSPLEMTYLPTGQKILFRGFDDVLKLASTTVETGYLCWVWIEEAYEIDAEADFEKLDLSVPRGKIPPHLFKQTTLTFNPWSEKHWLKARFFDKASPDADTFSTNYLINEFLDETDRAVFEKLRREHPRRYRVAGLGEWGISEGLVFENWCEGIPDTEQGEWQAFFGLDYGYTTDPTAFIAIKVNSNDKIIYVFDEFCKTKMLNSDIAKAIISMGYGKERIRADSAEPKTNDDLRRLGLLRLLPSVKGRDSVINGIMNISEYKIFVHPKCKNTLSELSSYCWDKSLPNTPQDQNNHLMDALRYAFYDVKNRGQPTRKFYHAKGGLTV